MAVNVRSGDRDQVFLLPPSVRDWLSEDHLAWFVIDAVDLAAFYGAYRADGRGGNDQPHFIPMATAVNENDHECAVELASLMLALVGRTQSVHVQHCTVGVPTTLTGESAEGRRSARRQSRSPRRAPTDRPA